MVPDPAGTLDAAGCDELLRLLRPVLHDVTAAVVDPPAIARDDWLGPASEACAQLESELRRRLLHVMGELDRVLAVVVRAS